MLQQPTSTGKRPLPGAGAQRRKAGSPSGMAHPVPICLYLRHPDRVVATSCHITICWSRLTPPPGGVKVIACPVTVSREPGSHAERWVAASGEPRKEGRALKSEKATVRPGAWPSGGQGRVVPPPGGGASFGLFRTSRCRRSEKPPQGNQAISFEKASGTFFNGLAQGPTTDALQ